MPNQPTGLPDSTQQFLDSLAAHRDLWTYAQTDAEAAEVKQVAQSVKTLRRKHGLERLRAALLLRIDMAALVAVENGYGPPDTARKLLAALQHLLADEQPEGGAPAASAQNRE